MNDDSINPGLLSSLIPRTRDGDETARDELLLVLQDFLTRTANGQVDAPLRQKAAVSDIVQLSLIRIYENFEQFRGSSSKELRAWIRQIVINETNLVRRHFKTKKRDFSREKSIDIDSGNQVFQPSDEQLTPASSAMRRERIEQFHAVLEHLRADQAEVIRLRSIERLSFSEVGRRTGRSGDAASQLWYRAIMKLEEVLARQGDIE